MEGLWQPYVEQVYLCHFFNSIRSLHVSVSNFGISRNISNPPLPKTSRLAEGSDDG